MNHMTLQARALVFVACGYLFATLCVCERPGIRQAKSINYMINGFPTAGRSGENAISHRFRCALWTFFSFFCLRVHRFCFSHSFAGVCVCVFGLFCEGVPGNCGVVPTCHTGLCCAGLCANDVG